MICSAVVAVALFSLLVQTAVIPKFEQFALRYLGDDAEEVSPLDEGCSEKIAIIGSGITGAVAAFNLYEGYRRQELPNQRPCITVFERNEIVGGRITETFIYGDPLRPIDTCADTFAIGDLCIGQTAADVGLIPLPEQILRPQAGVGVWDAESIVNLVDATGFRDPLLWSYFKEKEWQKRYKGFPLEFDFNVTEVRRRFDQILPPSIQVIGAPVPPGERNLSEAVRRIQLDKLVQNPLCYNDAFGFLDEDGGDQFFQEAIVPGVRERFFTNGLSFKMLELYLGFEEALTTLVEGGNLRLIERLLKLSGATVRLNTEVLRLETFQGGARSSLTTYSQNGDLKVEEFDTVVVATSLERGGIEFDPALPDIPGLKQQYEDSVVTHFTTSSRLNPTFFNWEGNMPQNIFTTEKDCENDDCERPPFFSLTFLREVPAPYDRTQIENLYKLVSREEIPDTTIEQYLMPLEDEPFKQLISWIDREVLLKSVPVTLGDSGVLCDDLLENIEITPGVYYAGGGEQVVASAEFGCRMGKNAADLILAGFQ